MAIKKKSSSASGKSPSFRIEGEIEREQPECQPGELTLTAYIFDRAGVLLGSADVDAKGHYAVNVRLKKPADVDLMVGPADMPQQIRQSGAFRKSFSAKEWEPARTQYRLKYDVLLPLDIWRPWWPQRICVSGHIRKIEHSDDGTEICPVPFVKVEIFDVDREFCYWPYFRKRWEDLLDRPVFRVPELIEEPPFPLKPFPVPDPVPDWNPEAVETLSPAPGMLSRLSEVAFNPQPEPPALPKVAINPQPEPPGVTAVQSAVTRVGEARLLDNSIASRLERLTLTSKIEPWVLFPHCYYSKAEVCETTTDCNGAFTCCFNWWPFHFRRGRLRFDSRPDIIVKVTQIIDGVETVIYMDPYTSTRWNVNTAHIDLFLDDEEVRCGAGCTDIPEGASTFFTLVGHDEVYRIDQTTGTYSQGAYANWAYGGKLLICALFGDALSSGTPKRYYRLSYKKGLANPSDPDDNSGFKPITETLRDTRVDKTTLDSESVLVGPQPAVNGVHNLYEIRNADDYYWYNPDKIGWFMSEGTEPDSGLYTLRLEVFDENGNKLTSTDVDYRDGTDAPPGPLPAMANRCDLVILIDNKYPELALTVPGASGTCGVVPFVAVPGLTVDINVDQAHGRLQTWSLSWVKGISGGYGILDSDFSNAGIAPLPVNTSVPAAPMTAGLTGTCAFSLTLGAWPLVRNGFGRIHYNHKTIAIAIEKCPS
jgi:hypothetical protein